MRIVLLKWNGETLIKWLSEQFWRWCSSVYVLIETSRVFQCVCAKGKRSGYYGNLGSLKAGTRHHGDYSVMGTPSLQPFLKTYWLTPVNDWPIVAKHANMTSSRGSINAAPATIRQNLNWTPLGWTSSDHGDHRDVSFPLSGNRGYHSNRSVPFQAVTRHHGDYSVMGTLFNPAVREATDSLNQIHSAKAFPPITELEGRAHSW